MHARDLLTTMATEIPAVIRQLESDDPLLRAAATQRLRDFERMLAPWRGRVLGRPVSRRGLLRAGAVTFAAMSVPRED